MAPAETNHPAPLLGHIEDVHGGALSLGNKRPSPIHTACGGQSMMTTNQARDILLESVPLTTELAKEIKNLAQKSNDDRKLDEETYFRCPRCYCHHSIHGNFDNLCDRKLDEETYFRCPRCY